MLTRVVSFQSEAGRRGRHIPVCLAKLRRVLKEEIRRPGGGASYGAMRLTLSRTNEVDRPRGLKEATKESSISWPR